MSNISASGRQREEQEVPALDDGPNLKKQRTTASPLVIDVDISDDDDGTAPTRISPAGTDTTESLTLQASTSDSKEESPKEEKKKAEAATRMMAFERNVWSETCGMDLESWLTSARPSQFSSLDYAWIQVHNANTKSAGYDASHDNDTFSSAAYEPALEEITKVIASGKKVSATMKTRCIAAITEIAKAQKCTVGKWMVFIKPHDADQQWEKIARATAEGTLGCSAKINPTKDIVQDALCCIYTKNLDDKQDVQRVLVALQGMGFAVKSGYKPDVFTHLGIYAKNEWRLPPTLYSVKDIMNWGSGNSTSSSIALPLPQSTTVIVKKKKITSWIEGGDKVDFEAWLQKNRPSQISESDCEWIQVENVVSVSPGYDATLLQRNDTTAFEVSAYQPALDKIAETIQSGKRVSGKIKMDCVNAIQETARQQHLIHGMWMLWLESDQADEKWQEIARATAQGKLGCKSQIKPSKTTASYESIVCLIHTKDFEDKDDIRRVLMALQDLGFTLRSGYKPEVFTLLGIKSNNEWRLPSTIYSVKEVEAWGKNSADDDDV